MAIEILEDFHQHERDHAHVEVPCDAKCQAKAYKEDMLLLKWAGIFLLCFFVFACTYSYLFDKIFNIKRKKHKNINESNNSRK
jgi:hypothetical protein